MNALEKYQETRRELYKLYDIQPESLTVATEGPVQHIHYLKAGSGSPLILIHGGGSHCSQFLNIVKPLSQHFELYVVDRPGCGLSDTIDYRGVDYEQSAVDFLDSFMNAVGLKSSILLGNSMGGFFILCYALRYPERVDKLMLVGAPAGMNRWIPPMLRLMGMKGLNRIIMNTVGKPSVKNVRNLFRQLLVADIGNVPEVFLEHTYYYQLLPNIRKSFRSLLENVLTLNGFREHLLLTDRLHRLQMPVSFIWGDQDVFEKPDSGRQKAKAVPQHTFNVVRNAGHLPWLDQPEACVSLIFQALREQPA